MNRNVRQVFFPLLTAFIWGTAFSAQSMATAHLGPLSFNAVRNVVAALALLVTDLAASRIIKGRRSLFQLNGAEWKHLLTGGSLCGLMLILASTTQQIGIADTSAGKTGFITAMYIVIVPLFGLFQGKRPTALLWGSVAVAAGGLYFLCVTESFTVAPSDLVVLLCAVLYAGHILVVDRFGGSLDGIQMSCVQFFTAMVLSGAGALAIEHPTMTSISLCVGPILYCGLLSSGLGYTLQILAQKDANPTVVSILLSMESVFAVIGGAVVLHERMGGREIFGCVLMLVAVILAQLPAATREADAKAGAGSGE